MWDFYKGNIYINNPINLLFYKNTHKTNFHTSTSEMYTYFTLTLLILTLLDFLSTITYIDIFNFILTIITIFLQTSFWKGQNAIKIHFGEMSLWWVKMQLNELKYSKVDRKSNRVNTRIVNVKCIYFFRLLIEWKFQFKSIIMK